MFHGVFRKTAYLNFIRRRLLLSFNQNKIILNWISHFAMCFSEFHFSFWDAVCGRVWCSLFFLLSTLLHAALFHSRMHFYVMVGCLAPLRMAFVPVLYLSLIGFSFLTFLCRFSICHCVDMCVCVLILQSHCQSIRSIVILTDLWFQLKKKFLLIPYVLITFTFALALNIIFLSLPLRSVLSHSNALSVSLYRVSIFTFCGQMNVRSERMVHLKFPHSVDRVHMFLNVPMHLFLSFFF